MNFLKCLRYINPNRLLGNFELINPRILSNLPISLDQPLLKINQDQFNLNQKRFTRFPTIKRRLTHKRLWWQKKTTKKNHNRMLTKSNQEFIQEHIRDRFSSPLIDVKIESKKWTPESKRTGLIARKIGNCLFKD